MRNFFSGIILENFVYFNIGNLCQKPDSVVPRKERGVGEFQ